MSLDFFERRSFDHILVLYLATRDVYCTGTVLVPYRTVQVRRREGVSRLRYDSNTV